MELLKSKYSFLISRYKNKIYGYAMYMLRDSMDADDVTQEAMIRIWQNIDKFNLLSAKSWIMRTTHNLCLDFLRRKAAYVKRGGSVTELMEEEIADHSGLNNPGVKTETAEIGQTLKTAIEKLPVSLKSVFLMYEIDGLKYREIGAALDMPVNSVKVYLLRTRVKLQDELKKLAEKGYLQ
jgi:RNA polymerase sigma-70 factor (ECF subfamily)